MSRPRVTPGLVAGCVLVALVVLAGVTSLVWTPADPAAMDVANRFAPPGAGHLLGTDQYGRDILSRVMAAARPALAAGVVSVALGAAAGTLVGTLAALGGRAVRAVAMRAVDGLMAFPGILLAMMLVLVCGRGLASVTVAVALFMVPTFARLTFGLASEARGSLYVKAAAGYGCGRLRLAVCHVLPVMAPRVVTQLSASVGTAMLLEASLSFLGLGVQPPEASWGVMLSESMQYALSYPGLAIAPGVALMLAVLGFNLLGDALNDALVRGGRHA